MKIYCNRHRYTDLKFFEGKDLWIKVYDESLAKLRYFYINPVDVREHHNSCEFYSISQRGVDFPIDKYDVENFPKNRMLHLRPLSNIRIVEPLECYTTEELKEILKHNLESGS